MIHPLPPSLHTGVPVVAPGPVVSFGIKGESPRVASPLMRLLFQDLDRFDDVIQRKVELFELIQGWECREKSLTDFLGMKNHEDLPSDM
tara:strand:- start:2261 stop:2527 length:267 start_codon:yes stop_codon:yes gene_type:complete